MYKSFNVSPIAAIFAANLLSFLVVQLATKNVQNSVNITNIAGNLDIIAGECQPEQDEKRRDVSSGSSRVDGDDNGVLTSSSGYKPGWMM